MSQRVRADDRGSASEHKFYVPAGTPSTSVVNWFERVWASLFDHGVAHDWRLD
jgi:hypothetical protein